MCALSHYFVVECDRTRQELCNTLHFFPCLASLSARMPLRFFAARSHQNNKLWAGPCSPGGCGVGGRELGCRPLPDHTVP